MAQGTDTLLICKENYNIKDEAHISYTSFSSTPPNEINLCHQK